MPTLVRAFVLIFALSDSVCAQHPAPGKIADLSLTAVGRQHHPIQTGSKEAQDYFDQGITLVYGFNHEEAARAFERAGQLDPASPMPLWGIALAVGPNYNLDVDAEREKQALRRSRGPRNSRSSSAGRAKLCERAAARYSGSRTPT
jgi:hypothetical protein